MTIARGIEIAYLYVTDLGRSIAFYEQAFGLSFARHGDDWAECTFPDGGRFGLHLAHPGELPQTPGTIVIDFRVEDLTLASERLRAMGVAVGAPHQVPTGRFCGFVDPDGYRLQVIEKAR